MLKNIKWSCAVTLAAMLLAGCADLSMGQRTAVSCRAYAATLSSLAELRAADKLSDSQVATVNQLRTIGNPICLDDTAQPGELDSLSDVLRDMSRIETEAKR